MGYRCCCCAPVTKRVWVQAPGTGELIPEAEYRQQAPSPYYVIPDIGAFETATGIVLDGRRALRQYLRQENIHVRETGEREAIDARRRGQEQSEARMLRRTLTAIAAERGIGDPTG